MQRYIAIIDFDDDHYGAYFPDAVGCTAMGDSEDEVIENAAEALAEWATDEYEAGRGLPRPRSYRELLKSGEYELGKAGMVAIIPLLIETGRPARANISLDSGLLSDLDEAANRAGVTRSAFIASAVRDRIKAKG